MATCDGATASQAGQPARRRPGRPSALTPNSEARILNAVRCGASYRSACMAAGIGKRTFQRWKARGQEEGAPAEYRHFWLALTRAEHEGQVARLAIIQKASQRDWRAAAWLAERMERDRLSLKFRIEHSTKPLTIAEAMGQIRRRRELLAEKDAKRQLPPGRDE